MLVESVYTGRAYSLNVDDTFAPLTTSYVFNVRLGYRFDLPASRATGLEVFVRADNLTDALVTPQLGLPDAGRTVRGGLELTL